MAFLRQLAFRFARFVAREHRRGYSRRTFFPAAARRWNSGRRREWNGGLRRHHHSNRWVSRRRFGPGGGLRRRLRGNRLRGNRRWAPQRHNRHGNRYPGEPGPSTTAALRREQTPVAAAKPAVVAVPEPVVVAVPDVAAPEAATEDVVDAVYEDEASVSDVSADADDLMPVPPEFAVPPMEWLLGGPSAGWLVDDPERDFSDDNLAAPPPPPPMSPMHYYMRHGFGPCLPSPTPSDEDAQHFAPPGYDSLPEFSAPPDVAQPETAAEEVEAVAPAPALPDLNLPAKEKEENEPVLALPTPSPEARVLLRRFAAAMAARPVGIRTGTWSPAALGFTDENGVLRIDEATTSSISSFADGPCRR